MKILINGESKDLDESLNLRELLTHFSLPSERIAVEVNKEVVRRKDWDSMVINNDDIIEIVHFVGGG